MARYAVAGLAAAALLFWTARLHADSAYGAAAALSLLLGAAFGAVLQRSRFCLASAFRDLFLNSDRRPMLGVLAALAAGSLGYLLVFGAQLPDPSRYLPPTAHIAPAHVHVLGGGAVFGLGMTLAGGCLSGQLYRLGEGSLSAPVALAAAFPGYWLAYAVWSPVYLAVVSTGPVVWLPQKLGYGGAAALQLAAFAGLAAFLLWKLPGLPPRERGALDLPGALRRTFVEGWPLWVGGLAVGALASAAYFRVAPLSTTSELNRLAHLAGRALSIAPAELAGLGAIPGCRPQATGGLFTQNALFVVGLVAGALTASLLAGEFRVRAPKPRTLALAAAGGLLMGFGAMLSLGCTVGTFLSGAMAFSAHGWVFGGGLALGAWGGTRILRRLA
jgi:hypothetical protein